MNKGEFPATTDRIFVGCLGLIALIGGTLCLVVLLPLNSLIFVIAEILVILLAIIFFHMAITGKGFAS